MPESLADPQPEFSRIVEVDRIGPEGADLELEANEGERADLARRFGLVSVDRLSARLTIKPVARNLYRVHGRFAAAVVQSCVVTLEPLAVTLAEELSELFGTVGPGAAALLYGSEQGEVPEPIDAGRIDVGEAVAQHLALALDPYPRRVDAVMPSQYAAPTGQELDEKGRPFAVLKTLKKGGEG